MKRVSLMLAVGAFALAACTTAPSSAPASSAALQETASLMVSIGQHGEDANVADLETQLDERVAATPNDPFVLKLVSQARRTLSSYSQDRAERVRLRHTALAELDKAISLAGPSTASRIVKLNGQETEIDLKDLPDLRAQLMQQVETDR